MLAVLAVALGVWAVMGSKKPAKTDKKAPTPVATAKVLVRDMPVAVTALGAAQAWNGVVVRAQVNGKLKTVGFREGAEVRAGQLLAEIDPAPFRAALTQAEGALKRDTAMLDAAKVDLARYEKLASQDSIARQQVDTQAALVKQYEGVVEIDQGQVATARINLGYTRIVSPIAGRAGVRLVDPGNLVSTTDTTGVVTVNQITPIAVTFTVPQGDFQRLSDASGAFSRALATQAFSQDTGAELGAGELTIADNHVDAATGSVALKARFPNAQRKLWPGQFVNVRLTLQTLSHALTVPATAVNQGPNGAFVYTVGADGKAELRPVTVATTQDATAVIQTGVKEGETVVTDGQMSLAPGSKVAVRAPGGGTGAGGHGGKRPAK